jgi:hypothetical protein
MTITVNNLHSINAALMRITQLQSRIELIDAFIASGPGVAVKINAEAHAGDEAQFRALGRLTFTGNRAERVLQLFREEAIVEYNTALATLNSFSSHFSHDFTEIE